MLEDAKRLIKLGLPIIPICPHDHARMTPKHIELCKCAGKTPLIRNWQTRTNTTEEDFNEWVRQFKSFNIGLPLGEASGYCGIDVDGEEGERFLQEMSGGDLPDTWEFSTGAGRRLLYLIPPGTKTKKFKQSPKGMCPECGEIAAQKTENCPQCGAQKIKWLTPEGGHEECALLCTGQQTVLPPSIHYTGRVYEWLPNYSPWDIDCAEAPQWLVNLIRVDENGERTQTKSSGMVLNLSDTPETSNDLAAEFERADFCEDIPDEIVNNQAVVKTQKKGKSGHSIIVTDEMLTSVIPEGQRDVTMTAIIGHYCANRDFRLLGKDFVMQVCMHHNRKYCDPPLDEASIAQKVNYFFEAEQIKDAKFKDVKKDKPQFEASKLAAVVRNQLQQQNIIVHFDQHSKMYYYTKPDLGPWICTRDTNIVNKWIRAVITHPAYGHPSWDKHGYVDEVRRALEELFTEAFRDFDAFDLGAHADEMSEYIVVNNGMLDWKTGNVLPWNPEFHTTISFDITYDPMAECPRFEQYMEQWLPNENIRKVVQEYVGYCLIPNTKFRKALFLYGKGKNGKSMLLEFLQDFFGDHKATLSYDGLFQRFGPANLKGKLVNIYDDTTVAFAKDTGIVKNLIAGGTISAEFKGKDHFTFTNVARFIFSAQETPRTSDHSEAWYDRWIFVKFPNKFKPSNEKKVEIQTALKEERAGIFNWMLEGLKRLFSQDGFSESEDLFITNQEYRNQNDSISMFVSNMCKYDGKQIGTTINDLYRVYTTWSDFEGLKPLSKRTFTERLQDLGYTKVKGYVNNKSGQTYLAHLVLDVDSEDYAENKLDYTLALSMK